MSDDGAPGAQRPPAARDLAPDDDRLLGLAGDLRRRQARPRRPARRRARRAVRTWRRPPTAMPRRSIACCARSPASASSPRRPPDSFALTPLAALLRTGTPDSMRALAITYNEEQYRAWGDLLHSVRTGAVAFEHHYGMPIFDYFAAAPRGRPGLQRGDDRLDHAGRRRGGRRVRLLPVRHRRRRGGRVRDAPGGHPAAQPGAHGDPLRPAPRGRRRRRARWRRPGSPTAASVSAATSSRRLPAGGDAYVLAQILHDWDDERCVAILRQCRRAMPEPTASCWSSSWCCRRGEEPFFGKWLDLHMLVMAGGRERTAAEYDALFRAAGFALARVVPTPAGPSVVEAAPV